MAKQPFTASPVTPSHPSHPSHPSDPSHSSRPSEPFGPFGGTEPFGAFEPSDHGTYTIDCATCIMQDTAACADCVVTFLCEREPDEAVLLDLGELQALRRLARAGLAPSLRHTAR